jgi:hypothetical protein
VEAGEIPGRAHPGVGDPVAEGSGNALDEAVQAQPSQVVSDLPAGHEVGGLPEQGRQVAAQVGVGEAVRQQAEDAQDGEESLGAGVGEAQPGHSGAGRGDDGSVTWARAPAPAMGLWLSVWAPSRRRLAVKPICRSAGRLVSLFPIPKSTETCTPSFARIGP